MIVFDKKMFLYLNHMSFVLQFLSSLNTWLYACCAIECYEVHELMYLDTTFATLGRLMMLLYLNHHFIKL